MKQVIYNKLVRDRIPEIIAASGRRCDTRVLSEAEYLAALKAKLREEVAEYEESGDPEELADILEAVHALAATGGGTPAGLEAMRAQKARARGGFAGRIMLLSVDGAD
ncbi:MAG: nucleoside triphosphate pyrophosphohydrolase [Clostridiales bacterium]|nr:nucleoside triphosphate pyrophosphohydrolase [Clostridiales bacterium]